MNRRPGGTAAIGGAWEKVNPPLTPWILDVVRNMGFLNMTPVQAGTIPRAMKNQDCVVEAVTGSGKTLAFVIPILERMVRNEKKYVKGEVAAVVIAPTRELASQIHEIFAHFLSSLTPPSASSPVASSSRSPSPLPPPPYSMPCLITSGIKDPHESFLSASSNIIVGTPGRLAAFFLSPKGQSLIRVSDLDTLVLDEADKLLSSVDHRRDIERILGYLPKQRRTHLFSATMTDAVEELVGLGLRNPVRIVVNLKDKRTGQEAKDVRTPTTLQNMYLACRYAERTLQLVRLLQSETKNHGSSKIIVYFSTCAAVDYFYRMLSKLPALKSFHLTSLHGDLPPRIRETALANFTRHSSSSLAPAVLLCTDVASRGVDFADVNTVIQFDAPSDPKTFSHRVGRTARAGQSGRAILFLSPKEAGYVDFLDNRKIPMIEHAYLDKDLNDSMNRQFIDPEAYTLMGILKSENKLDRELHDKAIKAFVSSIRAYTKHEASYIFRKENLDYKDMAVQYGLLRLPAMPEVKDWKKRVETKRKMDEKRREIGEVVEVDEVIQWEEEEIDWGSFAYKNKDKEVARLATLSQKRAQHSQPKDGEGEKKRKIRAELREAWSEQKEKKVRKEERHERKERRKDAEWEQMKAEGGDQEIGMVEDFKRRKVRMEDKEEWDREYKALKKELKGEKLNKVEMASKDTSMFDGLD